MTKAGFYDLLAGDYHLIYPDWETSITAQAEVLDAIIAEESGAGPHRILDCACGIGTQTLGLARLGHQMTASDLSPIALDRAHQEAVNAGLHNIRFRVADFQTLSKTIGGKYRVIIACDNSLPHLLTSDAIRSACINFRECLEPAGILLLSIRDYDQILAAPPTGTQPREMLSNGRRRIVFQVWNWKDEVTYSTELFLLQETAAGWNVKSLRTVYRAWLRTELDVILAETGFSDLRWRFPEESGYFQPILTARAKI